MPIDTMPKNTARTLTRFRIMLKKKKPMTVFSWKGERDTLFSSYDSLFYYKQFLQTGMMAMDPISGHIKAWVGGIDHKFFKFDHVRQQKRQAGSTFKPFVYGLAMESELLSVFTPCEIFHLSLTITRSASLVSCQFGWPSERNGKANDHSPGHGSIC